MVMVSESLSELSAVSNKPLGLIELSREVALTRALHVKISRLSGTGEKSAGDWSTLGGSERGSQWYSGVDGTAELFVAFCPVLLRVSIFKIASWRQSDKL
jgi:hypothetical protein